MLRDQKIQVELISFSFAQWSLHKKHTNLLHFNRGLSKHKRSFTWRNPWQFGLSFLSSAVHSTPDGRMSGKTVRDLPSTGRQIRKLGQDYSARCPCVTSANNIPFSECVLFENLITGITRIVPKNEAQYHLDLSNIWMTSVNLFKIFLSYLLHTVKVNRVCSS